MTKAKGGVQAQPYGFNAKFERAVVFLACTQPVFMARTANLLEADLLRNPENRLALEGAQLLYREQGRGPANPLAVVQRTNARREEGKLRQEDVEAVHAALDELLGEAPAVEDIEPGVVQVLRKRLRHAIATAAVDEHNDDEWRKVHELMQQEQALGVADTATGIYVDESAPSALEAHFGPLDALPLGIEVLDEAMKGGVPNGTLTCFMGAAGAGKSMALSHCAAAQVLAGKSVGYATLELPSRMVVARILAAQTGLEVRELLDSPQARTDALSQTRARLGGKKGYLVVKDFAAHATTVEALTAWVREVQGEWGKKMDVLIVDYADKLTASGKVDEKGMYQEMRIVYEKLRLYVDSMKMLGITASQSRGREERKSKKQPIDMEHTADSMHKVRIVDQFITLNYDDDAHEMLFFLAKSRHDEGRKRIGPVPANFAMGQVAPFVRAVLPDLVSRIRPSAQQPLPQSMREPGEDEE